ncbi:hypothetical protein QYN14_25735 [Rhodococcus ruber]|uniref:hypothetical protein n=1 Tax=Rhodococcus ruber TaxID=1830 RepID=UPI002659A949|nr:hypothetical protein [Rhodococcus ruber]WKK11952.1 hypothetical protein QYN14_25320 [Rhodococcus ruber]WKK12035.1 hypothetical protein QYN14_25735 [Rhodococcus ruber]
MSTTAYTYCPGSRQHTTTPGHRCLCERPAGHQIDHTAHRCVCGFQWAVTR